MANGGFFGGLAQGFVAGAALRDRYDANKTAKAAEEALTGIFSQQAPEGVDPQMFNRKLVEYLARRGFEYDVAREVAERHWANLMAEE